MNVGLLFPFRNPPQWRMEFPEFYSQTLRQIQIAEELGFDMVWLTEHHFSEDGYLPSLLPMAAAIAVKTSRIRIGTNVLLLPLHNALRIAEDAAVVDILSNGRFELGVGLGYTVSEFEGYGISRKERASRLEEGLAIIEAAWSGETFSFSGKHYDLKDVRLMPRPVQTPRPPIWVGGGAPAAIDRIARLGYDFLCPGFPEIQQRFDAAVVSYGRDPADVRLSHNHWCYVAETREQAWDEYQEHLHYMLAMYQKWLREGGGDFPANQNNELPPPSEMRHVAGKLTATPIVGAPDDVFEQIQTLRSEIRTTHMSLGMHIAGLPFEKAERSMRLFAQKVLPALRAAGTP